MQVTRYEGPPPDPYALVAGLYERGMTPERWTRPPNTREEWRSKPHITTIICLRGTITVHTREGDVELKVGDRIEIEPGYDHAISIGPLGAECAEGRRLG